MAGYRPPYTIDEQRKIVRYICDKQKFYSLRGNEFWQQMEDDRIINRTWQSAKEHFRKQIVPILNDPRLGLTQEEIRSIKEGYDETGMPTRWKAKQRNRSSDVPSSAPKTVDLSDIIDSSDEEV